jgi:hypothetical protein
LPVTPPTVTTTGPVVAPGGTGARIVSDPQLVGEAGTPLNVTLPAVGIVPKLKPLMVTLVPTGPVVGLSPVIVGPLGTVNRTALLTPAGLYVVTTTGPVVTPVGAVVDSGGAITWMTFGVQFNTCADMPLKVTDEFDCAYDPKLLPTILTNVPGSPAEGVMPDIQGGDSGIVADVLPVKLLSPP